MSKVIVVTGGCGYIGSHVARAFKQNGDRVFIIDRVEREHTLKDIDGYYIDDFASDASLATMFDLQPDVIVHCAGTSLVGPSMTDPAEYYDNNVVKTIRLMDTIRHWDKPPAVMFSSSASVYGTPKELPIAESAPKQPISPYGSTKLTDEMILRDFGSAYGIDTVIFRYFNAAGAEPVNFDLGQEPEATHIVARVLEASIAGRAFTLNGDDYPTPDGSCVRDYVHVWDIAQAHVDAAYWIEQLSPEVIGADRTALQETFNLGTNKGISNKEIVNYVSEKYGLKFVNFGPRRIGDPPELVADATNAQQVLNWIPKYSTLEQIVDSAFKWYTR